MQAAAVKRLVLPLALLLLAACAEVWVRPGTTEEEADAMNAACREAAFAAVPPQMSLQMVRPARIDRDRICREDRGEQRCRFVDRYRPPEWDWVDMAAGPREAWRRQCMVDKGFTFEGYRPLRLH